MLNALSEKTIDYSWNNLTTYLVLVPCLSLLVREIQLAKILPLPKPDFNHIPHLDKASSKNKWEKYSIKANRLDNICRWHSRGAAIQVLVSAIAVKIFALPFFSLLGAFSTYELAATIATSLMNPVTIVRVNANGMPAGITCRNPSLLF